MKADFMERIDFASVPVSAIERRLLRIADCERRVAAAEAALEHELAPRYSDWADLERIYAAFCNSPHADVAPVERRERFVLIALLLFAPGALLGRGVPRGMGRELSRVLGESKFAVSRCLSSLPLRYRLYMRRKADLWLRDVTERLHNEERGL